MDNKLQGKTFLTALFCVTRCILFPESKIVIASGTLKQAIEVIDKISDVRGNSKNLDKEIRYLSTSTNNARIDFYNGSWMKCVPASDNARCGRANVLVVDEFRIPKLHIINKVLKKFLTAPRSPKYLDKPEYSHLKRERNKELYLSSAYYKHHWSWDKCKAFLGMMTKGSEYFICSLPYQLPIKEGLLSLEQIQEERQEADFDAIGFEMEMKSLFFGANENGYFGFDDLDKNRILTMPLLHSSQYDLVPDKAFKKKSKGKDTIRVLACDIAGRGGAKNDASAFTVLDAIPNAKNTLYRVEVPFITTLNGGHTEIQALKIKQLFKEYDCDYIVLDIQNIGLAIFDSLSSATFDKETGESYPPLNCRNSADLQERALEQDAERVIYAISGNAKLNSDCAKLVKDRFSRGLIKLLINETDARTHLDNFKGYSSLEIEDKAELEKAYRQTSALINEMINLNVEYKENSIIRLSEQGSNRKDRYSSISYGMYFINELEFENLREEASDDDDPLVFF